MTVYAFIMTLIVGIFIGGVGVTAIACRMDERKRSQELAKLYHPSNGPTRLRPAATVGQNPFA